MLTYFIWSYSDNIDLFDYFTCVFLSIFTIMLDIMISPIELATLIIWGLSQRK